jgi:hypothetical protein
MSTPNLYDDARRTAFLATLPEHLRSRASNLVLARIRAGATKQETTYALTVLKLRHHLGGWGPRTTTPVPSWARSSATIPRPWPIAPGAWSGSA